jgi:hypothetical protein
MEIEREQQEGGHSILEAKVDEFVLAEHDSYCLAGKFSTQSHDCSWNVCWVESMFRNS